VERTVQVCVFCWFRSAAQFSFREVFGVVAIVLLIAPLLMAFVPSQERRSRLAAACCTAAAGFTVMALQILLLLGFESVYGYVYHELSILSACAWAVLRWEAGLPCGAQAIRINLVAAR